jgi:K+-transporting ATPase A subunit
MTGGAAANGSAISGMTDSPEFFHLLQTVMLMATGGGGERRIFFLEFPLL